MKGLKAHKLQCTQRSEGLKSFKAGKLNDKKFSRAFSQALSQKGSYFPRPQGSGSKNSARTYFSQFPDQRASKTSKGASKVIKFSRDSKLKRLMGLLCSNVLFSSCLISFMGRAWDVPY